MFNRNSFFFSRIKQRYCQSTFLPKLNKFENSFPTYLFYVVNVASDITFLPPASNEIIHSRFFHSIQIGVSSRLLISTRARAQHLAILPSTSVHPRYFYVLFSWNRSFFRIHDVLIARSSLCIPRPSMFLRRTLRYVFLESSVISDLFFFRNLGLISDEPCASLLNLVELIEIRILCKIIDIDTVKTNERYISSLKHEQEEEEEEEKKKKYESNVAARRSSRKKYFSRAPLYESVMEQPNARALSEICSFAFHSESFLHFRIK